MNAKYWIEVDTYWQGSQSIFIGPFSTREAAEQAARESDATKEGRFAKDYRNGTRYQIHNTTQARRTGMKANNTLPATVKVPGTVREFERVITDHLYD